MSIIQAYIKRHPLVSYFVLTFAISWGGILLVVGGPSGLPGTKEQTDRLLPLGIVAMIAGPSLTGILMTGLLNGSAGLREFRSRMLKWRVSPRWYAVALLTTPLLAGAALFALLPTSPAFLPGIFASSDKASLLLFAIVVGLVAGIFEELGWTGFAVPIMRQRHGVLAAGISIGLLWGAWHYLVMFWASGTSSGEFSWLLLLPQLLFYVAVLPAYRVLMVWVYDRTESLPVSMLMHASLTGNMIFILMPSGISGVALLTWYLAFAAVLWVVVFALAIPNRGLLFRPTITAPRT